MAAFDASLFFAAFADVGFLTPAIIDYQFGGSVALDVGFEEPAGDEFGEVVVRQYQIEYPTASAPNTRQGDWVTLQGKRFRISEPPRPKGDGSFTIARLVLAP